MNSLVTIKSIPNGIKVLLDPDCDFSLIIEELGKKFRDSKNFFKGGRLCVTFSGRVLSEVEENTLVGTMETNGEFTVLYLVSESGNEEDRITKALAGSRLKDDDINGFGAVYRGSVFKGEHLQFSTGVLILGDVEPGALIKASGNVIILGGLYGSVNIECESGTPGFVFALELSPERIRICDARYYSPDKPKWSIKPKYQGKIAYLSEGKVIAKEATAQNLKEMLKG